METNGTPLLSVSNIEVIYDHVILVLRGVSLDVPEGGIVTLLGANGAGKSTTLKSISNLLGAERGEVTKGSITYQDERVEARTPSEMVKMGVVQVMEGRHCFEHLTVEENLLTGAYTRTDGRGAIERDLEMVYSYFPRIKERNRAQAGYTSGGEQQMTALGRALMAKPSMILLDEPSMGLAPQLVEEIFEIVKKLNENEGGDVPPCRAEHQHGAALRPLRVHPRERARGDGRRGERARRQRGRQGVLPRHQQRRAQELPRHQALPPAQALAGVARERVGRLPHSLLAAHSA